MSDIPGHITITEEGPREGFQIEPGPIPPAQKIALIEALAETGLREIQVVSFVNPKRVPGMADADQVVAGLTAHDGVAYTALWLNDQGFLRAAATGKLDLRATLSLSASAGFIQRNQNRTPAEALAAQHASLELYRAHRVPIEQGFISAAFGCNFDGDIPVERVVRITDDLLALAGDHGVTLPRINLADTMAWATPGSVRRVVGAVRERHPDLEIALHLHDTRGLGLANAYAGLEMGVRHFDAAIGGLGGCPFAEHQGAAGNVCTEDLAFMCEEMGIDTGLDLDRLIAAARLAEQIVGHPLPGAVKQGGSLKRLRQARAAG
jgi:hydroxymethylglutaryl-CoA lyase